MDLHYGLMNIKYLNYIQIFIHFLELQTCIELTQKSRNSLDKLVNCIPYDKA